MNRPSALRPGDRVAVIAPSSPFRAQDLEPGLARIAARYRPIVSDGLASRARYLAGSDERRLEELRSALLTPDIRAVFCARGGYGAMRLLESLDFAPVDKPLVGFSDITVLHCALQAAGRVSIHGPVLTQLGRMGEAEANELFRLLEEPAATPCLEGRTLVAGSAEGRIIGGNLSRITRLLGTPYMPPLEDAILFFEDVGERPYRLDRMWQHLKLAGVFKKVRGLALGDFTGCDETQDGDWTARQILAELAAETGLPCVIDLPAGHGSRNRPFPLGARAQLDATAGTLRFLEGAVR